jgi:alkaline phosphatase D
MNSTTRRHVLTLTAGAALAPWFVRHAMAADTPRFALGIASGHPRADRLVLWTRLTGDPLPERVDVRWELAHDEAFKNIAASGVDVAEAAWAHSVHAEPAGLQPGRWYWYRFTALGQQSAVGRTRTAPAPDAAVSALRFTIASCQRWDHGHYAAWRHMATQELDLVLFLGDYIYEYASPPAAVRLHDGPMARSTNTAPATRSTRPTRPCRPRMPSRRGWRCGTTTRSRTTTPPTRRRCPTPSSTTAAPRRRRRTGSTCRFRR